MLRCQASANEFAQGLDKGPTCYFLWGGMCVLCDMTEERERGREREGEREREREREGERESV